MRDNNIKKIADNYGLSAQSDMLIEEMAELTQAICKMKRKNDNKVKENLIEEIADVQIMLNQIIYLHDCKERVYKMIDYKLNRTLRRMMEEDNEI